LQPWRSVPERGLPAEPVLEATGAA
jgi:hypothetical protein